MRDQDQCTAGVRLAASLALVALLLSSLPLYGQAVKASLVGTITDSSGAVVPGVDVVITEVNTNFSRSAPSNENGYYVFGNVSPGVYRVEARLTGFKTAVQDKVDVLVNTTVRVDLQLQPGTISEAVEVTAVATALQTDRSDVGRKIETRQLENLPLTNGNFQALVNLTPEPFVPAALGIFQPSGQSLLKSTASPAWRITFRSKASTTTTGPVC
jgi:hypothetical protein